MKAASSALRAFRSRTGLQQTTCWIVVALLVAQDFGKEKIITMACKMGLLTLELNMPVKTLNEWKALFYP